MRNEVVEAPAFLEPEDLKRERRLTLIIDADAYVAFGDLLRSAVGAVQEVAGSNPAPPTTISKRTGAAFIAAPLFYF